MTLIILLYALWASSMPISKYLLGFSSPFFLAGIRFFVSGVLVLGYQYFYAHEHFRFKKKHWPLYAQLIIIGTCITYILRLWALQGLSATKTHFMYNLAPFMASFYSYLIFDERMSKNQWLGLFVGFLGMVPILLSSSAPESAGGEFMYLSWQEIAVLISIATHTYSWIIMRKLVRYKSYSPTMVNGVTMTIGGTFFLIASALYEVWYQGIVPVSPEHVGNFATWVFIIILTSNVLCHNLYGHLLKKYTATFLSFAGFLSPLFTALYGWSFLGETMTWHFYASVPIVFVGLLLFYKDELAKQKANLNLV